MDELFFFGSESIWKLSVSAFYLLKVRSFASTRQAEHVDSACYTHSSEAQFGSDMETEIEFGYESAFSLRLGKCVNTQWKDTLYHKLQAGYLPGFGLAYCFCAPFYDRMLFLSYITLWRTAFLWLA